MNSLRHCEQSEAIHDFRLHGLPRWPSLSISSLQSPSAAWFDASDKIDRQAPANAVGRWRPLLNLGTEFQDQGNYIEALRLFSQAEAAVATQNYYARALTYFYQGNRAASAQDLELAMRAEVARLRIERDSSRITAW